MPDDRMAIIERLRKEAIDRCKKRIEDAVAGRSKNAYSGTHIRQDYGLMTGFKKARGL
ncbi:MAG: hypothetical protein A4E28_02910 [Methanocella sp. PtaU1.Bin125]|nr:MAG: hypothetical protein A4E28_02910 [Methanocella sp. PtaU1.Bin125]